MTNEPQEKSLEELMSEVELPKDTEETADTLSEGLGAINELQAGGNFPPNEQKGDPDADKKEIPTVPDPPAEPVADKPQSKATQSLSAKVIVNKFDAVQQIGFLFFGYDLRNEKSRIQAKADEDAIMEKVYEGGTLTAQETTKLKEARDYIKAYDEEKNNLKAQLSLSDDDKEMLQKSITTYIEETKTKLPDWFNIALIVGGQIISNSYAVASTNVPLYKSETE